MEKNFPENCKCLLSYEPKSPRCVVLVVDADEPVIWFCRVGGKEWTRHEYTITVEKSPILFFYLPYRELKDECAEHSSHGETSSEHISSGEGNAKRRRISNDVHDSGSANESRCYERFKIGSIVSIDEKFYFDISTSELGVIEFTPNPTFSTIKFKTLTVARNCWELAFPHLVESRGRLPSCL
uniref:Uncharacterized protein n=1 Tax=Leersia perrieri TaxID=77586 RepID=A0A0D9VYL4_9ORYZ